MATMKTKLTVTATMLFLFCGCGKSPDSPVSASTGKPAAPVTTQRAVMESVTDDIEAVANIQFDPSQVVHVYPPASGKLLSVNVKLGDVVKEGQTLAMLMSSDAASARSDYEKAKIESERSDRAAQRAADLYEHHALAEKDLVDTKAAADSAKSEMVRALQRLGMLGLDEKNLSDNVPIRAPRSGVVFELGSAAGELSRSLDNANSIITLGGLDSVWVVADVLENDLTSIHAGQAVEIRISAFPGKAWNGTVAAVSDTLDPVSRTVKVRVTLPNPGHTLKPEMFATMRIHQPARKVIKLPASAVLRDGEIAYVFISSSGKYLRKDVALGHSNTSTCEIVSGINAGDLVVVTGAGFLNTQQESN